MATRGAQAGNPTAPHEGARMVADVGGTHARFAVVGASPHDLNDVQVLRCADYPDIRDALTDYRRRQHIGSVQELCIAVAGPVGDDLVQLPNGPWRFSVGALQRHLGCPLKVINDFTAQALAIAVLGEDHLAWVGTPRPVGGGPRAIIGPGTGLGVAIQTVDGEVLPSEGGHVGFAPNDPHELKLLGVLLSRFQRVSAERLLSGPGLENLFWANRALSGPESLGQDCPAPEVARLAAEGDPVALRSVHDFFDILAAFAGDIALLTLATGGVYLSGGVLRHLSGFLDVTRFRARFEQKGRLSGLSKSMPLAWVTHHQPGLLGCAAALHSAEPVPRFAHTAAPS